MITQDSKILKRKPDGLSAKEIYKPISNNSVESSNRAICLLASRPHLDKTQLLPERPAWPLRERRKRDRDDESKVAPSLS